MKPLSIAEHIQLTLLVEGARTAWLIDSRFVEKEFSLEKFKKLVKKFKNKDGEKIYKNIEFNTYDHKVIFAYNKLLSNPIPPENGVNYSVLEIGRILGYIYPLETLNHEDEYYTARIVAVLKNEEHNYSSSIEEDFHSDPINKNNFEDIPHEKKVLLNITISMVPKDKSLEPYKEVVEKYIKAILSSKNDYLKSKVESHNFIRLGIFIEYSLKYLIEKLLSEDKLSKSEQEHVKHDIFNLSGWEKAYKFDYNFDNKIQRFLIVNTLTILDNNYGLAELNEDDFLNLLKIADR